MSNLTFIDIVGTTIVASPALLLAILGVSLLLGIRLAESVISLLTQVSVGAGLTAATLTLAYMLYTGSRELQFELGNWVVLEEEHFHFHFKFIFDRLSVPFLLMSFVLCGTVGVFTRRYLHRDIGYRRFFFLYSLFYTGMIVSSVAGTIETLFFGWELVGLSSALLVAYFHERENPVQNGLRVWSIYRLADAAFLIAALMMHHLTEDGDFGAFSGIGPWPDSDSSISSFHALIVGSLLLFAAAGKSALVPFSGWLPRAMEGPTPSSAVFYGSLSVHLGAYLLLRVSPILERSVTIRIAVIALGAISAVSGAMMSHVQSDVKSSLAYASLTQVGIIVVEIGLGFYYLALIHIIGHACMRTLQLLRAPSLLLDYQSIENAIGQRFERERKSIFAMSPKWLQLAVYRFGFERGYMDISLDRFIVYPILLAFRMSDKWERMWTDWLSREPSRQSDFIELHPEESEQDSA